MRVNGTHYRGIWLDPDGGAVCIIDQTQLPWSWVERRLTSEAEVAEAIGTMRVRGAPLIGAAGAYGLYLAALADPDEAALRAAHDRLLATRPTAVNLRRDLAAMLDGLLAVAPENRSDAGRRQADAIADAEAETGRRIGEHGLPLIEQALAKQGDAGPVNILTHCNAGWLACVDWGTALAPVYRAHDAGIPVHVWVDETRPRNQGAALTTWELAAHGVPHTLVADNAGGHLMQQGRVDLCLVGTDRTTRKGDVANKIGTYLKALAARASGVPFHVALPGTTIDWATADGADIPIEERAAEEVLRVRGRTEDGHITDVAIAPEGTPATNPAFDVTPAEMVTGLITERGRCAASKAGLAGLYPEEVP